METNIMKLDCNGETFVFPKIGTITPTIENDAIKTHTSAVNGVTYCEFHVEFPRESGVYLWVLNGDIQYIGYSKDINKQFNIGFGNITERNCESDGQITNCRLNNAVFNEYKQGNLFQIFFYKTLLTRQIKAKLLEKYTTKYNKTNK